MATSFPGKLEVDDVVTELPTRKRSSVSKMLLSFRPRNGSPRSSVDSTRSSLDLPSTPNSRRPSQTSKLDLTKSTSSGNKLRKSSTLAEAGENEAYQRDKVTGELKDPTNMMHSLAHEFDTPERDKLVKTDTNSPARSAQAVIDILPVAIWDYIITSYLSLADQTALCLSAKAWSSVHASGKPLIPFTVLDELNQEPSYRERCDFLYRLNPHYPNHLLCYPCAKYHVRLQPGKEVLKPTNIANPLYTCPYVSTSDPRYRTARTRTTFGRALPFSFLSLALRHESLGPSYGIPYLELGRRYKDRETVGKWSHQTRWAVIDNHLYMRIVSTCFATPNLPPAGMRHLLYTREDFTPFFSVCAHWRDGELMPACKCALSHIPAPLSGSGALRLAQEMNRHFKGPQNPMVRQCDFCKPMRRCPMCPTEYLIEIRMQEDRAEPDPTKLFKYAIVVTRWSDLGSGKAPWSGEWAAVNNEIPEQGMEYDSFQQLGRRAVSGTFESFFNPEQIPPARLISLNPNMVKLGERGHNWY